MTTILIMLVCLESPHFETRHLAEEGLRQQGIVALPYLETRNTESLEAKVRIDRLKREIRNNYIDSWSKSKKWKIIWFNCALPDSYIMRVAYAYCATHNITMEQYNKISVVGFYHVMAREATRALVLDRIEAGESFSRMEELVEK